MRLGLGGVFVVAAALVLSGCTSSPSPPPAAPATGPAPAAEPSEPVQSAAGSPGAVLVSYAQSPLGLAVLPKGFTFVNAVDVAEGSREVSHVYAGPGGPGGPVLFVNTGVAPARPGQATSQPAQEELPALSQEFPVSITRGTSSSARVVVTIDVSPAGLVRVSAEDLPEAEVLGVVQRLITAAQAG